MSDQETIDVLNSLLEAEYGSLIPRLGEVVPFVNWAAARDRALAARMVADGEAHRRGLAELILKLRGAPVSPRREIDSGGMHYVELTHLVPHIIAGLRGLVAAYDAASNFGNPDAITLIARNRENYRSALAELEERHGHLARSGG